jgi:hypothetical protein
MEQTEANSSEVEFENLLATAAQRFRDRQSEHKTASESVDTRFGRDSGSNRERSHE